MPRILKYNEALREATDQMMAIDPSIFVIGLGASYRNGCDGSTAGLKAKYPDRIFDVPVSEAAFTGMAVGAAINGLKPIVHHGRVEFALFAADQIFTQAANWNYMFGGDNNVPIVFRINVGRQWGNGPQHTKALYSLFGSVPGLKAVIPSTPYMAKGLLVSAIQDKNPVVLLESRWLFQVKENVPEELYNVPLDRARVAREGSDITVVAYGDGFIAAHEALSLIGNQADVELIDLVSLNLIDYETIFNSVEKTGSLLCVDTVPAPFSIGSEIAASAAERFPGVFISFLSCPFVPCPTSPVLTESYYPTKIDIAHRILSLMKKSPMPASPLAFEELHLAPTLLYSV